MNLFENQKYYSKDTFDEVDYEDQNKLFLKIRAWVPNIEEEYRYNKDTYTEIVIKRIEKICAYACSGHVPSQDYMCYIYKRGFWDIFPVNYKRSLEWGIIAARNGSKTAPDKMKAFLNPAIDMIGNSPRWEQIIKYNDLNLKNYFWFLSQYVCELLYHDLALDPVEMSKKELIEEDSDRRRVRVFMDRFRDRCVTKAIEKLTEKLPEKMPKDSKASKDAEDILRDNAGENVNNDVFVDIDIEDI